MRACIFAMFACSLAMANKDWTIPTKTETDDKALEVAKVCTEEVGLTDDIPSRIEDFSPAERETFYCAVACLFKHLKFMHANGTFNAEFIYDIVPQRTLQIVRGSVEHCQMTVSKDACKLAGCILQFGWFELSTFKHLFL